jgi:hypothetical protein
MNNLITKRITRVAVFYLSAILSVIPQIMVIQSFVKSNQIKNKSAFGVVLLNIFSYSWDLYLIIPVGVLTFWYIKKLNIEKDWSSCLLVTLFL